MRTYNPRASIKGSATASCKRHAKLGMPACKRGSSMEVSIKKIQPAEQGNINVLREHGEGHRKRASVCIMCVHAARNRVLQPWIRSSAC